MHHMLIGEKSFWHPFWQVINLSDMPMRWEPEEVRELQDAYLEREIGTYKDEYFNEFYLIFNCFREHEYEHVWPGICDPTKTEKEIIAWMEPFFYKCFNTIVTRCFGWGLPKTSLIPYADCINHHNVDSTYEFICEELHEPMKFESDKEELYSIDIAEYINEKRKQLDLADNPIDQDDASYYTKSKMMFDISDFYKNDANEGTKTDGEDMRSKKLTNRSIHTIKKMLIREEAYKVTPTQLLNESALTPNNDIWDLDYKSTSDEEDNDSSDEDEYGKVVYPKPRLANTP